MRDRWALRGLFEKGAVLAGREGSPVARGRMRIVDAATRGWARDELYLAASLRVVQTRSTALIAGPYATSLARRSGDGAWRYSIALLHSQPQPQRRTP